MKILGILLMVIGLFMMVSPVFLPKEKEPEAEGVMMMKSESLPLASLMGVCFLATGGALLVASVVTKKK